MTHLLIVIPRLALTTTRDVVLAVLPHGGQRAARRNAWAGMSEGAARSRARREADVAVSQAEHRSSARQRSAQAR